MNVKYDFTQTGGFPLDQNVLNDLQNGILEAEGALASVLGPLAIVSGCVVTGGSASNGVVAINGEILPFVGGVINAKVIVIENDTPLTYFNASTPATLKTRYATFGDDGVQNNPWANFVRNTAAGMWQTGDVKEIDVSESYLTANFDGTGLGTNLRLGWAICNGNNGTKDRRGKVAVMRDTSQSEFATMTTTGGSKAHTLIASDIPVLATDAILDAGPGTAVQGLVKVAASGSSLTTIPVNSGTANNPVSLLQPYCVTLFIQKL